MAKCECCGKGVTFGIKVSHSHRRSNRTWKPNVRRVKAVVEGSTKYVYACSRCLRAGKVTRAVYFGVCCRSLCRVAGFFICRKERNKMSLPVDPIMLLSVVNLKLRDQYKDLDALCEDLEADKAGLCAKLHAVGYDYDPQRNQFV